MKASWTINRVPEKRLVEITTAGTMTARDSERLIAEIAALGLDPAKDRLLVDHRAADLKFTTLNIYELPQTYQIQAGSERFRVATVFKTLEPNQKFYRDICRRYGFKRFEVFSDYDEALRWLTTPERR